MYLGFQQPDFLLGQTVLSDLFIHWGLSGTFKFSFACSLDPRSASWTEFGTDQSDGDLKLNNACQVPSKLTGNTEGLAQIPVAFF